MLLFQGAKYLDDPSEVFEGLPTPFPHFLDPMHVSCELKVIVDSPISSSSDHVLFTCMHRSRYGP